MSNQIHHLNNGARAPFIVLKTRTRLWAHETHLLADDIVDIQTIRRKNYYSIFTIDFNSFIYKSLMGHLSI